MQGHPPCASVDAGKVLQFWKTLSAELPEDVSTGCPGFLFCANCSDTRFSQLHFSHGLFLMYGPHLPFPLVSALLWTHCPVGFCHYRFRLDPLGSSDGCAWCGCGVLMVVFGVVVELWRLCLSLRGWRREVPWCGDVWWRGTALRLAQGLLAHLSGHPQGMCCHSNCR